MTHIPRSALRLQKEMRHVKEHSQSASKLFKEFVDLHLEREELRHYVHPNHPDRDFKRLKKNVDREAAILRILDHKLEDVNEELADAIEGFKKSTRIVGNDAIKELNFLKEFVEAIVDNMDFLREKQKYYQKNKTSYAQLREAIAEKHEEEKNRLEKISHMIAPIRLQRIENDALAAEKVLEGCKHNKEKLNQLIAEYRKQIVNGRKFALGAGLMLAMAFSTVSVDYDEDSMIRIVTFLTGVTAITHFLLASLVGFKKLYIEMEKDAAKDTKM